MIEFYSPFSRKYLILTPRLRRQFNEHRRPRMERLAHSTSIQKPCAAPTLQRVQQLQRPRPHRGVDQQHTSLRDAAPDLQTERDAEETIRDVWGIYASLLFPGTHLEGAGR